MGMVTNALPTTMSAVKASGIGSSQNSLRAYLIGGAAGVNSNTAGHLGFIPSSGTVTLSQFRDATRANLSTGTSITGSATVTAYSGSAASATVTVSFSSAGILSVSPSTGGPVGREEILSNSTHANQWLIRTGSSCLANTANNWQVKIMKTGGNGTVTNNNTWQSLGTTITCSVSAASSGNQTVSQNLTANVQIRRADTLSVVMMTNMSISCSSTSTTSVPP